MNRKHMVETTLLFLDSNAGIWQNIARIAQVKNQLSQVNKSIELVAVEQQSAQVNVGKIKTSLKRTIAEKADILNDLVEVYATMTNNPTLAQTMSDSYSDLYEMRNSDMSRRVKQIIDSTTEHQDVLVAEFGLTTEQITDLQADYDYYMELSGQPREYQIKSGVATMTLEEYFTEIDQLLSNQLDNLMKVFKRREPTFYNGYLKARMVVNN